MRNYSLFTFISVACVTFVSATAMAECPANTYECGSEYCVPDGGDCCADFGRPDKYCSSGSHCTADGCESNSSTGSSGGSSQTGGVCDSGQTLCGDGCMPSGGDCCADFGRPDKYCSAGLHCTSTGCASDSGGSSSSGTGSVGSDPTGSYCPSGQTFCGSDSCMPIGADCCLDMGRAAYCPSGSHCVSSGCLKDSSTGSTSTGTGSGTTSSGTGSGTTSSGTGSGTTSSGTGSGTTSSGTGSGTVGTGSYDGTTFCSEPVAAGSCNRYQACSTGSSSWYLADSRRFNCEGVNCVSAAEQVASYCGGSSTGSGSPGSTTSSDDATGCNVNPVTHNRAPFALIVAISGLLLSVRGKRRRANGTRR